MIDLRYKGLPNTITVEGSPFLIKTDFREWIKFSELIKNDKLTYDRLFYLFENKIPYSDFFPQLVEFFSNPNATPKIEGGNDDILDYVLDGEYIYGSFMQVYGIDLTECDMHWHKFKALFLCLPDNCKIKEIIGFRSFEKPNKDLKHEDLYLKAKETWALPIVNINKEKLMDEINAQFYNC